MLSWKETRERLLKANPKLGIQTEHKWQIDLRGANLRDAYLRDANLSGVDLNGADLRGANLRGADLHGAGLHGADLSFVDLNGAYLGGAYLRNAYLSNADLRNADLRNAYLSGAYLSNADLRNADLSNADLSGANLRGAYLSGAYLSNVTVNWNSHALIAELLKRAAGNEIEKLKVAGLILLMTEWCWDKFLKLDEPLAEWALDVLAGYVVEGDNAPAVLRRLAKKAEPTQ